jgi:hypothetical protein
MKKYVFKDVGWWEYSYCDCCGDRYIESWCCIRGEVYHDCGCVEECCVAALYAEGCLDVSNGQPNWDKIYEMSIDQLKQLCEDNGIEVVFVNEEDLKYE